jgi:hypothetical protein
MTALIVASNSISVYGPPLFDVSACCPRYTVGQIVARVTFTDRNGNNVWLKLQSRQPST